MYRLVLFVILAGLLSACGDEDINAVVSRQGPGHYDDFNGSTINLAKWDVSMTGGAIVSVGGGFANLALATAGADMQSSLSFPLGLVGAIRSFTTAMRPLTYSENTGSNVRYRMFLRVYKDDKYTGGGLISDIFAQLRMRGGQWQAMVSRCIDAACGSEVISGPTNLGPAVVGQAYRTTISWNGGTGFGFDVGGLGGVQVNANPAGAYTVAGPSGAPSAKLEVVASEGAPTIGSVGVGVDFVECRKAGNVPC